MLARKHIDRHRQQYYYGLRSTNVTRHLGCVPPSHAYSRELIRAPPPSYHRRASSITENVLGAVHVKRFDPSLPDASYHRQATDVTEQLRFVPPAHAMGSIVPDPWFGRSRTYVTNPAVDDYSIPQSTHVESQAKSVIQQPRVAPPSNAGGSAESGSWFGRSRTYITNPEVDDYSMYEVKHDDASTTNQFDHHEGNQETNRGCDEHSLLQAEPHKPSQGRKLDEESRSMSTEPDDGSSQYGRHEDMIRNETHSELGSHYSDSAPQEREKGGRSDAKDDENEDWDSHSELQSQCASQSSSHQRVRKARGSGKGRARSNPKQHSRHR
ncbi:hypothetical protein KP509_39G041100 [Ceratopteris richardii]|uniref:Uncharacterized protein n=1 Tax=Ceratopteris richardii TaxID=49495 RepID=A0A8T2Q0N9_CERRI|nr:hypothetical protein KP509_39G041100 [Ceratopteris richardii]